MNYKNLVVSIIFVIFITLTLQLFDNKSGCDSKDLKNEGFVGNRISSDWFIYQTNSKFT